MIRISAPKPERSFPKSSGLRQTAVRSKPASGLDISRSLGNRQVGDMPRLQAKPTLGQPGDRFEQEAERTAQQILSMSDAAAQSDPGHPGFDRSIQRMTAGDPGGSVIAPEIDLQPEGGQPLTVATRQFMEPRFGANFSHVRLHADVRAQRSAESIQARAFTYQNHIWLGRGESEADRGLMAHELTHVIQQSGAGSADKTSGVVRRLPFGVGLPTGTRALHATLEKPILTAVYGSSLNYGDIYLSDGLGGGGRPFTLYVPFVGTIIQIGPGPYTSPGSNPSLLIHEAAHSWQSQHYFDKAAYMANSVASQAAASIAGGSSYCYIPGKPFNAYGAEQIAQQAENGVTAITSHMSSIGAGSVDPDLSLVMPRWETPGAPGVVC